MRLAIGVLGLSVRRQYGLTMTAEQCEVALEVCDSQQREGRSPVAQWAEHAAVNRDEPKGNIGP